MAKYEEPTEGSGRAINSRRPRVAVTPDAIVFTLSDEHREAARHCLDKSGRVTFTFREVSVTDLLELKELDGPDGGVIVD